MKRPSKKAWIALILIVLVVIVIAIVTGKNVRERVELADSNIVFVNESDCVIAGVGVYFPCMDGSSSSEMGMNADGSPLKRGTRLLFSAEGWPAVVSVYGDVQGEELLASVIIEQKPPETLEEGIWYVVARDGADGVELTLSLNLDENDLKKMAEIISENLRMDTSAGMIRYCWYPGHSPNGDGEDFVTVKFEAAAALEQDLANTEGWAPFPVPEELKKAIFSPYSEVELIDWSSLSQTGWFYFRDEYDGQRVPGLYNSPDFVAAVYDSAAGILHFFEWHQ